MPKISDKVKVLISEKTNSEAGEDRTWTIEVSAPAEQFRLSDELARRQIIPALEPQLRAEVKRIVSDYIGSADTFF